MNHRVFITFAALVGLVTPTLGCDDSTYQSTNHDPEPVETETREDAAKFVVHEWGTFTSVQDSEGRVREGLHHEEHGLPPFVYGRDIGSPLAKAMESLPEGVNQKLETPVIYFYNDEALDVSVKVDFPDGVISEWYPDADEFAPMVGDLQRMGDGTMTWNARVEPTTLEVPWVPEDDIWAPSRRVSAASVTVADQSERFIFYRGLGRFGLPIRVVWRDNMIHVENSSSDLIPRVFLLHVHDGGGAVVDLGELPGGGTIEASPSPKERELPVYVADASDQLAAALVESGLYEDEALAMVDTWASSYFEHQGLRVLYIAPRTWTDALLPITVNPAPDELVRTMVGRVEIITPDEERQTVSMVEQAAAGGPPVQLEELGRFAEPRLRRTLELLEDPVARDYCESLIEEATVQP